MTITRRDARSPAQPSRSSLVIAALVALLVVAGPSTALWWWPTQGSWMESAHIAPDDAHELGHGGGRSHWGVHFGSALDLDGNTLVVGTQLDSHRDGVWSPTSDGADWAYVFTREVDGTWNQAAKLIPSDAHKGDTFAYAVAVDDESGVIAVGNPGRDERTNKIYIFERQEDGHWTEAASFKRTSEYENEPFGMAVAVSGHRVVAGVHPQTFIFEKLGGSWTETETFPGSGKVAIKKETLVASVWDPNTLKNRFNVFSHTEHGWEPTGFVDPAGAFESENTVACTVRLNEAATTMVIGACIDRRLYGIPTEAEVPGVAGAGVNAGPVGSAWVYEIVDGKWEQTADIPNPDPSLLGDNFGRSVDASGDLVVVGAPWDIENGAGDGSGATYVYQKVGSAWLLVAKLRNHDNGPYGGGDRFGNAVAISGNTIAAGAPIDDNRRDGIPAPLDDDGDIPACLHPDLVWGCDEGENAGSVYVFDRLNTAIASTHT